MNAVSPVRPSPIAGSWYAGEPQALARAVDAHLVQATLPDLDGEVVAIIAPHAGHMYSGPVAGHAFAAVRGQAFDLVAVVSPMHQPYQQPLLTTAHDFYGTPLGEVAVDRASLSALENALLERIGMGITAVARDREHSLEIEIPFLQRALVPGFRLLPVMLRSQQPGVAQALGEALAGVLGGRRALLVASTDLSHFYDQRTAARLDGGMMQCFECFDPPAIFELEASGKGQACGHAAVAAVLWAARGLGATQVRLLHYATSGDVTGDFSSVVGYGAAAVLRTARRQPA